MIIVIVDAVVVPVVVVFIAVVAVFVLLVTNGRFESYLYDRSCLERCSCRRAQRTALGVAAS